MATNTTNYSLKKPAQDDFYNVDDFNVNADIIDEQLKTNADNAVAAKTTADAALPQSSFTGAQILSKMASAGSVLPVANGGTGAVDLTGFVRTYDGYGNTVFGDNLDNWKTSGTFSTIGSVSSTSPSGYTTYNYPSDWAGDAWATVMIGAKKNGTSVTQTLWFWNDASKKLYTRTYYNSAWSSWVKIATSANLASLIQSLLTGGEISVIKSIQRGYVSYTSPAYSSSAECPTYLDITISSVNTSKAFDIVLGGGNPYDSFEQTHGVLVNSTTLRLYGMVRYMNNNNYYLYVYPTEWQVIELY